MDLTKCVDGTPVRYFPNLKAPESWGGIVDGDPWQLGHGTWVVNLRDMDPTYRDGQRKRVTAAMVSGLKLDHAAVAREVPQMTTFGGSQRGGKTEAIRQAQEAQAGTPDLTTLTKGEAEAVLAVLRWARDNHRGEYDRTFLTHPLMNAWDKLHDIAR